MCVRCLYAVCTLCVYALCVCTLCSGCRLSHYAVIRGPHGFRIDVDNRVINIHLLVTTVTYLNLPNHNDIHALSTLMKTDRALKCLDGRIVRCGIISSWQSVATSDIVKHFWS